MNSVKVISLCLSLLVCGIIDVNAQWVQSGNTLTTPASELILNTNSNPISTIWLNNKGAGPGSRGQYYIKSFDWWGATLHFEGTGDQDDERMNVTFDGNVGIGTKNPSTKLFVTTPFDGLVWNTTLANEYHTQQGRPGVGLKFKLGDNSESWKWAGISAISSREWENYIDLVFYTPHGDGTNPERMRILSNGNVAIGRSTAETKLDVAGTIRANEIKVEAATTSQLNVDGTIHAANIKVAANGQTADFVFEDGYDLKELAEVEAYIKENKHLPNIPSATDMEANGVDVAEMNKLLLQKVEELTLYVIEKEKQVDVLTTEIESQKTEAINQQLKVLSMEERLMRLETLLTIKP